MKEGLITLVWGKDLSALAWWRALHLRLARILFVIGRDLADGQLTLRAMSLVYTTLLSLVPLLAISFSVLKGFGVHNQVEPILFNFLEPLGEQGVEIATRLTGFVEKIEVGVLGSLGMALLIYTVISLMQKIERAFNYTWHVSRQRTLTRRFSDYLSVVLIGPVLIAASLGISASIMGAPVVQQLTAIQPIGSATRIAGEILPFVINVAAFTFFYVFIPNTKVRLGSALCGALTAGILWKLMGLGFAAFILGSTKYAAI
ncbi:MAG: YihY/virulence factor BrkB family protein, partial [Rhodospirillales bacterium]|nr:YihY/virulence factor BrkB family protein [Rhodospirillales bacterium]